jgi:methionyl aminopeptidase
MRLAGRLTADVLDMIGEYVVAGVTTDELDRRCHDYIVNVQNAIPAPLNYHGFPKSICTSVNHVVCHGIPGEKRLKVGDIVNVDVTVIKDGWLGDSSRMFVVGPPSVQAKRLVRNLPSRPSGAGIGVRPAGHPNRRYWPCDSDVCGRLRATRSVREYCGHGIGQVFHEDPQILHYGKPGTGATLEVGQTFTIEPMINAGARHVRLLGDGWTVVTKDHSLSAQWEHTLLVTPTGCEILTLGAGELRRRGQRLVSVPPLPVGVAADAPSLIVHWPVLAMATDKLATTSLDTPAEAIGAFKSVIESASADLKARFEADGARRRPRPGTRQTD